MFGCLPDLPCSSKHLLDKFSMFFGNFVLAYYRTPGGLLGRNRAQSTQKTTKNLKIGPKTPKISKTTLFRHKKNKRNHRKTLKPMKT